MTSARKLRSAPAVASSRIALCRRFSPLLAVLLWSVGIAGASAQDASDWDAQAHSAARLIAGAKSKSRDATFLRAGIELKLAPGWRTYWRDPGDSGAPPIIDFSGSENVKSVNVLWPAPQRFPDGAGGNSIGYTDHVILPLHVILAQDGKESALRLKLGYDICSNICIPVEADLALRLTGDGAEDTAIERAELRVPRRVVVGTGRPQPRTELQSEHSAQAFAAVSAQRPGDGLAILRVHRDPAAQAGLHDRVLIEVAAPPGMPVDLFVEGPTPDWALPLPQQTDAPNAPNDTIRQFAFELDGLPPGAKPEGAELTLTAISGDDAIEVTTHLD
jgi:DsbC/DsbD-like thiol-disulfide interchange protein